MEELRNIEAPSERVDELMRWVKVGLPNLSDDVKRHLLKQQVEMFNIEYGRYMGGTEITNELIDALMEDAIDTHVYGGLDPFERRQLEDEVTIDCHAYVTRCSGRRELWEDREKGFGIHQPLHERRT